MNKIYSIILTVCALGAFTSCNEESPAQQGEGKVSLSMYINDEVKVFSRSLTDEETNSLEEGCKIYVYSSKGLIRKYHGMSEVPAEIWLNSGSYSADAWAGDSVPASFTDKYYKGHVNFEVTKETPAQAKIECKIANVVTSVKWDASVAEVLKDYKMTISHSEGSLDFNESNTDAKGYFMMPDGDKNLTWTITGTKLDGSQYTQQGTIENVKPTTEYALKVSFNDSFDVNVGGALFTVVIDESAIEVNDEFQLTAAPKIIGNGFDIANPVFGEPGTMDKVSVYVTSATALNKLELSGLTSIGFTGDVVDYMSMTELAKQGLSNFGIDVVYVYDSEADTGVAKITFGAEMLDKLALGQYPINISATDAKGKTTTAILDLQISKDPIKAYDIVAEEVYAKHATIRGSIVKDGATGIQFEYRKATESAWTSVNAVVAGTEFSAELQGLTPNTNYQFRVKCSNDGNGNAYTSITNKAFTTEAAMQVENGGFENWSTASDGAIIPAASESALYWDCGNHGSITMSVNVTNKDSNVKNSGSYSAYMKSQFVGVGGFLGKFAAGNIYVGKYLRTDGTDGVLGFGRSFLSRPESMTCYVKYRPQPITDTSVSGVNKGDSDKGIVYVALVDETTESDNGSTWPVIVRTKDKHLFNKDGANVIAYGEVIFTSNTDGDGMQKCDIKLTYKNNKKPKAILIVASSSYYGDYFTGGRGSEMWLDDITLNY